jgi:urea carboxylase
VDAWIETGTEVPSSYDPMLAKIITSGRSRAEAWGGLAAALGSTRIDGIETNLGFLRAIATDDVVAAGRHSTSTLSTIVDAEPRVSVQRAGLMTTVQDWPGRVGYWQVGVPPSGPMDDLSFRLGNVALGNPEGAAGLECTVSGPQLLFSAETVVCVTGAEAPVTVDGAAAAMWEPLVVPAGGVLDVGSVTGAGLRSYILFAGGLDVPLYLGSASTFTLGQFGGHAGRALASTDVLRVVDRPLSVAAAPTDVAPTDATPAGAAPVDPSVRPTLVHHWELAVTEGPHAAPDFFTRADIDEILSADYEVHFNSARTGVRLVGPKPSWARADGGEAGLHPSNIHDNAYAIGAVDFTGDTPILLGPDGPSLGGFVCPVTVISADRWKLGQLAPGDTVRFVPIPAATAPSLALLDARRAAGDPTVARRGRDGDDGVILRVDGDPSATYRRSGDDNILVEYGDIVLDLGLRARVHALYLLLQDAAIDGVLDLTPGIR